MAAASALDNTAWLGSADDWGLLGLPVAGGPVSYRRAGTLESPTWAPPELERITGAWSAEKAIWVQFGGSRVARYEYATGHLLTWEEIPAAERALWLEGRRDLVIAPGGEALELVGPVEEWRIELPAPLIGLRDAGGGRLLAVLGDADGVELLVLEPTADSILGRRRVPGLRDLAVAAWGERLYYVATDSVVRGLALPSLEDAEQIALPGAGRVLTLTPSAHRIYVAGADSIYVLDRLRRQLLRSVAMPDSVTALRFGITGASLLARVGGPETRIAVVAQGVDSLSGVVPGDWDEDLPVVVPGGRLVVRQGPELVLYDASSLAELARAEVGEGQRWFAVEWQPPRPRQEVARPTRAPASVRAAPAPEAEGEEIDPNLSATPGFYAVVSAARERAGVDNLVTWLRSIGYPGVVDRHVDPMGVTWYRAMVGPYTGRPQAEEAAQSLAARYGYKPWILSVSAAEEEEREGEEEGDAAGNGAAPAGPDSG